MGGIVRITDWEFESPIELASTSKVISRRRAGHEMDELVVWVGGAISSSLVKLDVSLGKRLSNSHTRRRRNRHSQTIDELEPRQLLAMTPVSLQNPITYGGIDGQVNQPQDRSGSATPVNDGQAVSMSGNCWKAIALPAGATTISADTVLSFDVTTNGLAEIHGIGFDNSTNAVNEAKTFNLAGTQAWGLQSFRVNPGTTTLSIPIGRYFTGTFCYLVLVNDNDFGTSVATTTFSSVKIGIESPVIAVTVNGAQNILPVTKFGTEQNSTGGGILSSPQDGSLLSLTGNVWGKTSLPGGAKFQISASTVIEFDVAIGALGEIHGIGFDNDELASADRSFRLAGTQSWGISKPLANGTQHVTIPVGQSFTGQFQYLVFINDHDISNPTAATSFRNINIRNANHPPVAENDSYTINPNEYTTFKLTRENNIPVDKRVLKNDSDPDNDVLTATIGVPPNSDDFPFFVLGSDGTFTIQSRPDFVGNGWFTYAVSDGHGGTATATVTITVSYTFSASNDEYYTEWETNQANGTIQTLAIGTADGLRSNDSSSTGVPSDLQYQVTPITSPVNGTVTIGLDGSFTYIPDPEKWVAAGVPEYQDFDKDGNLLETDDVPKMPVMEKGDAFRYRVTDLATGDVKYGRVDIQPPRRYLLGDFGNAAVQGLGGLVLMGGGADVDAAFQWMMARANYGDFVVLRGTGSPISYTDYIWNGLGGKNGILNSVETLVIDSAALASNASIVNIVQNAEAIFLAGGDQWQYISTWGGGSSLQAALNAALASGTVVVGGTSAGLHVLGDVDYSAQLDGVTSPVAVANPTNNLMTYDSSFLHPGPLTGVITDTHFAERDRMGRLMAFVGMQNLKGLAVNEASAIVVTPAGMATVLGASGGYFVANASPAATSPNGALSHTVRVRKVRAGDFFALNDAWTFSNNSFGTVYQISVQNGIYTSSKFDMQVY